MKDCPVEKSIQVLYNLHNRTTYLSLCYNCLIFTGIIFTVHYFRYICSIEENAKEGTQLVFEGGLDKVEDPDKVFI